jgi:transposase-like protein
MSDPTAYESGPTYQRRWDRISQYTPDIGEFICARIEDGETVADICRQPTMPSRATIYYWVKTRPDFGLLFEAARTGARSRQIRDETARLNRESWLRVRRQRRPGDVRGSSYTAAMGELICERLAQGEPLKSIAADPLMPAASTLYNWLREHDHFRSLYRLGRQAQAETRIELAWEIAKAATPETIKVARLQIRALRWRWSLLTPKKYG